MRRQRLGFTLFEIVVTSALASLLLTLAIQIVIPAMKSSAATSARVQMQQSAVIALNRMVADLESSLAAGIALHNNDTTGEVFLGIHPIVDVTSTKPSTQIYSRQMVLYRHLAGSNLLQRQLWPPNPSGNAPSVDGVKIPSPFMALRLSNDDLHILCTAAHDRQTLSQDVKSFRMVSSAAPPQIGQPIQMRLELSRSEHGKDIHFALQRSVHLRNSE